MNYYFKPLFIAIALTFNGCINQEKSDYEYSKKESELFLIEIKKKAKISIGDFTEWKKQPTDLLYFSTRYPISEAGLEEFNKNEGTIINKDDDIWDFTTYVVKDYELINEKNEELQLVDNGRANYLQEFALWDYDKILCQKLGIKIKLDKKYEKLKGHILIEFEMPEKVKKEVTVPVNITILDKVPE